MFQHFTDSARKAVQLANQEAHRFKHEYVGTEHILLGLILEGNHVAVNVLKNLGVDVRGIREKIERLVPTLPRPSESSAPDKLALSQRAKKVIELAMTEAASLKHDYVGTEHILLGLLGESEGVAAQSLTTLGLCLGEVRAAVLAFLRANNPLAVMGPTVLGTLRIIDAAANRAAEGFRVVEDYVRFVLDDRHLTGLCKDLRHDLAAALVVFIRTQRLLARETIADVGVDVKTEAEQQRPDLAAVVQANFQRAVQALRSLEEFSKLTDAAAARRFEQLRYRAYTLERAIDITRHSIERLADAKLYVLIDGRESEQTLATLVGDLVAAGVHVLQLRDKKLLDRELLSCARMVRALTRGTRTLFIMNDRPDLAALADADGVHVGQAELSVKDARSIVGPDKLIGVSTHSLDQARQAVLDGANYIGVGPVFPSQTKPFDEFPGLDLVRAVVAEIRLPVFAIGGITAENAAQVLAAGAKRIAVSAAVSGAADPRAAVVSLLQILGGTP